MDNHIGSYRMLINKFLARGGRHLCISIFTTERVDLPFPFGAIKSDKEQQ